MRNLPNQCARYFAEQIANIPNVTIAAPVDANTVFLMASDDILNGLPRLEVLHLHRRSGAHHVCLGYGFDARRRFGPRSARVRGFVILYWGTAAETAIYEIGRNAFLMRDLRISLLKYLFCTGGDCCPASC